MEKDFLRYVICYDIQDGKRRTKLAKMLDSFGTRAQFSVFEAALDKKLLDIVVNRILEIIKPQEDDVTIYRICSACARERKALGRSSGRALPGEEIVFIA